MSRKPCCVREGLKKGVWTIEEDKKLISYIHEHGEGGWRDIPQKAGLKRCGKSCRLRWANYLKPDIKRGEFSYEEEQIIIMLHASRGNKWSVIAKHLPKRTDNEIKNYWNTNLKKRLIDQGIDPLTHKPLGSTPEPATPKTSDFQDDSNPSNLDEQSHSGSMSLKSLPLSSSSCNLLEISNRDEVPRNYGTLNSKISSYTSELLNKVAPRAASMGNIISASMEGTLIPSTTLSPPCLNDGLSETSHFQMDEFDIDVNFDFNNSEHDFSQFMEEFSNNAAEEADNIIGYDQDLLLSDVSSTNVDEDGMMPNITSWSNYLLDDSDFSYDTNQD
ncbi:hypothetical protein HID58_050330 [Brassica napus]|uniref:Uncharacterized protein n=1 Tax=Brassica napus TaxID=3708 RepID=A0ABQ8A737_BRANA|nr:transcription factor MYB29-like [Brassica napus]KAH0887901.1 hypothetical protein HID58_050330 [Brassica napus]